MKQKKKIMAVLLCTVLLGTSCAKAVEEKVVDEVTTINQTVQTSEEQGITIDQTVQASEEQKITIDQTVQTSTEEETAVVVEKTEEEKTTEHPSESTTAVQSTDAQTEPEEEGLETLPQGYVTYCMNKAEEADENMGIMLANARDEIYCLIKAYDEMVKVKYEGWDCSQDIFTDSIIDELCGGNSVAKEAVSAALDSFNSGDGAEDVFGNAMSAAVDEIPDYIQGEFLSCLFDGYFEKAIDICNAFDTTNSSQIAYAIHLLENKLKSSVDTFVYLLTSEEVTGEDLDDCVYIMNNIYELVKELEHTFGRDISADEWKMLNMMLTAYCEAYIRSERTRDFYTAYAQIEPEKYYSFMETEGEISSEELLQIAIDMDDYLNLEFIPTYIYDFSLTDDIEALRGFDYGQLSENEAENETLHIINSLFGNFITDMLLSDKVNEANEKIDAIYNLTGTCQSALDVHRSGVYGIDGIIDEIYWAFNEFYGTAVGNEPLEEKQYMWFIICDYFGESKKPSMEIYQDNIDSNAPEAYAYSTLLDCYVAPMQAILMNMELDTNSQYIEKIEALPARINNALYYRTDVSDSADTSKEELEIIDAYVHAIDSICGSKIYVPDIKEKKKSMYIEGVGECEIRVCYKTRTFSSMDYTTRFPIYTTLTVNGEEKLRVYSDGGPVKLVINGVDYVTYGTKYVEKKYINYILSTNMPDLDNTESGWWTNSLLKDEVNDYYLYLMNMQLEVVLSFDDSTKDARALEYILKVALQMLEMLPGEPVVYFQ